ncbi:MAG: hypothetical protein ACRDDX_10470 [Cellulosilyticaceae bacterium]
MRYIVLRVINEYHGKINGQKWDRFHLQVQEGSKITTTWLLRLQGSYPKTIKPDDVIEDGRVVGRIKVDEQMSLF